MGKSTDKWEAQAELNRRILGRLADLEAQLQAPEPEPRPKLMYVDDVPADGTCEVRWWRHAAGWSAWHRVMEREHASDEHERYFLFVGESPLKGCRFERDRGVQVRRVA